MADDGGHNIFVYTGGEQEVPAGVTHVRIDRSIRQNYSSQGILSTCKLGVCRDA